jgi:CheY-like chemotaxis protein
VTTTYLNSKFLLADDDADDAQIFQEALAGIAATIECKIAENGMKVFEWLSVHAYEPDVIFLDINMPQMSGWECLGKLKGSAEYQHIPVVMYSTSSAQKDIGMAYGAGASLFLTKPEDFRELCKILEIVATGSTDRWADRLKIFRNIALR